MRTFWRHTLRYFFHELAFLRNKYGAYVRALRCPWHLPFGIKEKKGSRWKKISHKEPRVNGLKLVKRSAKVDSSRSVSYGKSSAESRKNGRNAEKRRPIKNRNTPTRIVATFGFMFGELLAVLDDSKFAWILGVSRGELSSISGKQDEK